MRTATKQLSDGTVAYYAYAWSGGPQIGCGKGQTLSEARSDLDTVLKTEESQAAIRSAMELKRKERQRYKPRSLNHNHVQMLITADAIEALKSSRQRAVQAGRAHTLTEEWLVDRLKAVKFRCELTGIRFEPRRTGYSEMRRNPWSLSIDRIDAKEGYTPKNSRLASVAANVAIGDWGEETFEAIAKAYLRQKKRARGQ